MPIIYYNDDRMSDKMSEQNIPNHVAIILDGNGRWATSRGLSRSEGHKAGLDNLKTLSKYIIEKGVNVLSVFAFSTENFKREQKEVDFLMNLFSSGLKNSLSSTYLYISKFLSIPSHPSIVAR